MTVSDGSRSLVNYSLGSQQSISGWPNVQPRTGSKLKITVVEGRNLLGKDKYGKCDPYVKLQYGKIIYRTRTILHVMDPVWNQNFEFGEIEGGEYIKIRCFSQDTFSDDNIGSARVNLEGLLEGSVRDIWGLILYSLRRTGISIQAYAFKSMQSTNGNSGSGWIELILVEARDLTAADLRGTRDPYVRVQYRNMKKKTKVHCGILRFKVEELSASSFEEIVCFTIKIGSHETTRSTF
ncbi:hypothetical protein GIB67_001456 [Kingdonia uniflora]|uniref:C2 domain-containing protein n=1 Tax=Kingdonia uniflora TaxID=39325 RepID=A0A7J7L6N3_9MAGN|nr:hypothetical protein GIB67_001456 [Kingdonia uniflora]